MSLAVATATLCAQASGCGDALPGDALHCREFFLERGYPCEQLARSGFGCLFGVHHSRYWLFSITEYATKACPALLLNVGALQYCTLLWREIKSSYRLASPAIGILLRGVALGLALIGLSCLALRGDVSQCLGVACLMQNKDALLCVLGIVHLICCPGGKWRSGKGLSCAASHALSLSCPLGFCFRHVCVFSSSSRG